MKKTIISILCVIAMLLSLSACVSPDVAVDALLQKLSEYAAASHDSYTIQIETSNRNGGKVTEKYTVTVSNGVRNVASRVETINPFIVDGDHIASPEEYMTVTEDSFTVSVSESNAFSLPSFQFSGATLSNVKWDEEVFPYVLTADVSSPSAFMGQDVSGSNVKLTVEYVVGSLYSLELSYKTESGNTVNVTYTFG